MGFCLHVWWPFLGYENICSLPRHPPTLKSWDMVVWHDVPFRNQNSLTFVSPELVRRGITQWAQPIYHRGISPQHATRLLPTWLPRYWGRMEDILRAIARPHILATAGLRGNGAKIKSPHGPVTQSQRLALDLTLVHPWYPPHAPVWQRQSQARSRHVPAPKASTPPA